MKICKATHKDTSNTRYTILKITPENRYIKCRPKVVYSSLLSNTR